MKLIFLDTETTGKEQKDRLCQVAYQVYDTGLGRCESEALVEYFKPPVPIEFEAMATHHITEEMVADKPAFIDSPMFNDLKGYLNDYDNALVAHNAKFDVDMLIKEGLAPKNIICTLKVARYLDKKAVLKNYTLQYLRYLLKLPVGDIQAHDARCDVIVLAELYKRQRDKMLEIANVPFPTDTDMARLMIEITKKPALIRRFTFGKHQGKTTQEVAENYPDYLDWLLRQKQQEDDGDGQKEDWIYTINYYLNGGHKNETVAENV